MDDVHVDKKNALRVTNIRNFEKNWIIIFKNLKSQVTTIDNGLEEEEKRLMVIVVWGRSKRGERNKYFILFYFYK